MGTKIVSWRPFGFGYSKPNHYRDMAKVAWENRDNFRYALRILRHGVCDGCSLGPFGLRDDTMKGVHLCMSRLRLLRLNTMPPLEIDNLRNVHDLQKLTGEELRNLGRLPYPMIRRKGEAGFHRISWKEAQETAAKYLRGIDPHRLALYTTSRGLTNETYYVAGKFARLMGTNNVDNAARLCHAASTVALKQTLGIAASTCSFKDWIGSELIILAGANIANNQPVATKYLYYAKQKGTRIAVINPFREPGLESYWIPSVAKSALFGTKLLDDFFPISVGGDVAFYNGVLKILIEQGWIDRNFVDSHTVGFDELKSALEIQQWEMLEKHSGTSQAEMFRFAEIYARSRTAIFVWSMGLTQHHFGVENVKALINVALARGMIGRAHTGLVPIRGHSGVQGAAEVGSVPNEYAFGFPVNEENATHFAQIWNVPEIPSWKGLAAPQMIEAAGRGELDAFYIIGGNFLETLPDPVHAKRALENVPLRIHQDLVLNSSMLADPAETVLLFPSRTRYEQEGGGTITSTERKIRYSPEIPGPRIGESRSEWQIIVDLGRSVLPEQNRAALDFRNADEIRQEIDQTIPLYAGTRKLKNEGDYVQYGGPRLLEGGICPVFSDQRGRFSVTVPQNQVVRPGEFYLTTRRGKQFNTILYGTDDPLTASRKRDEIFVSPSDAERLKLQEGDRLKLQSEHGEFQGTCRITSVHPGTLQAYWPEASVLIGRSLDVQSNEPDYNAIVTINPLPSN